MPKFVVLCWEPGSGGDIIQNLLLADQDNFNGVIERFEQTLQGRCKPKCYELYKNHFPSDYDRWYFRHWTKEECDKLIELSANLDSKYFILPTHLVTEAEFLRNNLEGCITMGVTYPTNMFPIVLKNWCQKVAPFSSPINQIYDSALCQSLKSKGVFGEFMLSEQLRMGTAIKSSVENIFDIEISLENLYNNDLSDVEKLCSVSDSGHRIFQSWLAAQSKIPQHRFDVAPELEQAIGFNSKITTLKQDIEIDNFDNILIKQYFKRPIPFFKTLRETNNFINP